MTFRRFPELAAEKSFRAPATNLSTPASFTPSSTLRWLRDRVDPRDMIRDFREFRKLPVFYSLWCLLFYCLPC
jgi:hypothetical protein